MTRWSSITSLGFWVTTWVEPLVLLYWTWKYHFLSLCIIDLTYNTSVVSNLIVCGARNCICFISLELITGPNTADIPWKSTWMICFKRGSHWMVSSLYYFPHNSDHLPNTFSFIHLLRHLLKKEHLLCVTLAWELWLTHRPVFRQERDHWGSNHFLTFYQECQFLSEP